MTHRTLVTWLLAGMLALAGVWPVLAAMHSSNAGVTPVVACHGESSHDHTDHATPCESPECAAVCASACAPVLVSAESDGALHPRRFAVPSTDTPLRLGTSVPPDTPPPIV